MKQIRFSSLVITTLLVLVLTSSKNKEVETNSGTLLWKITSENCTQPSYLYGTLHILPENEFFMADDAIKCLDSVKSLTLEINVDLSLKEQVAVAQRMMLPQGKTIKNYMAENDYSVLYSYLKDSVGIKENKIERYMKFKPVNLLSFVCLEYYGKVKMYEKEFSDIAKKNKIHINGLETIDEQFSALEKTGIDMEMPVGDDVNFLSEYEKMKSVYLQKNLDSLTVFLSYEMEQEKDKYANLEAELLTNRNKNWIPKIDSIVSTEASFIAVGAGHLGGDDGVINLLREKGYTLTPYSE